MSPFNSGVRKRCGFTLVELVTVIVILAITTAIATPIFIDYRNQAQLSSEKQVVSAVRQSLQNRHLDNLIDGGNQYPITLDAAPANSTASNSNPMFTKVLAFAVTERWQKGDSALAYKSPTGVAYRYDPVRGTFETYDGDGGSILSSYTLEELLAMTPEQLAALGIDEIQALTGEQIAALSYKQFEAIAAMLKPEQIPLARPDQIAMLSADAFGELSQGQLAYMTQAQVDERAFADQVRSLAYGDIRHLDVDAIKYLTTTQIASIPNNYAMGQIPNELRAAFSEDQIQALNTSNVSIGYLSADQRELLTRQQIASLGTYGDIRHVPASRIGEVTTELIASIPNSYAMGQIPADVRAGFSAEQIQAIDTGSVSIGYLTGDQRQSLTTSQIAGLGSYGDIRHVPDNRIGDVSTSLIAQIPNSYAMGQIPGDVRANFSADQIQAIDTGSVSIGYLTGDQRQSLTTSQIAGLGSYGDIRHVPDSRIGDVSTSLISQIPNSYAMGQIPDSVRAGFSAEQVQAIDTNSVSIGYLTSDQRQSLTTSQIETISTYGDIRHVPVSRITEVTPTLVSSIPNSYAMGQISSSVRAGFNTEQVQAINTSSVSIGYLNQSQRDQLTTQQVASLGSTGDIRHLSADRIGEVSNSLVSQISNAYEFNQISVANVQAFTQQQVTSISGDFYDSIKHRLTAEQQGWRP